MQGFDFQSLLGAGEVSRVYQATQVNLGRMVAVKILSPGASADVRETFLQQARGAGRFTHSNIVHVHDVCAEPEATFYAMELMEGGSAAKRLLDSGPLDELAVLRVLEGIGEALGYCEQQHLVHRDVKLDNILFASNGSAKLSDLGIAAEMAAVGGVPTGEIGNIYFMSPEQIRGGAPSPASDLYALGACCWQLLTGKPLFDGSKREIATAHVNSPVPDLCALAPHVSPMTAQVIGQLLAKDPEERPVSGGAVAEFARGVQDQAAGPDYAGASSSLVGSSAGVCSASSAPHSRPLRGTSFAPSLSCSVSYCKNSAYMSPCGGSAASPSRKET